MKVLVRRALPPYWDRTFVKSKTNRSRAGRARPPRLVLGGAWTPGDGADRQAAVRSARGTVSTRRIGFASVPSCLQEEYRAWREGMPDSMRDSKTAELLDEVCELDLDVLDVDLPRGFGRD